MMTKTKDNNIFQTFDFEIINQPLKSGSFNMDYDFQRMQDVQKGLAKPMFRLYSWKPWCLSLGYNQKDTKIDKENLEAKGYDLVRRPTGGRAVLHANEATYSIVLNLNDGLNQQEVYKQVHLMLIQAFENLGADIDYNRNQANFKSIYKDQNNSLSCFASSARYEVTHKGKKIVGSAQRVFGNTLLQHGSILLDYGYEQISEFTSISEQQKKILKQFTIDNTSNLSQAIGRKADYNEVVESIIGVIGGW